MQKLVFIFTLLVAIAASAQDQRLLSQDDLKDALKARYDQKILVPVINGLSAGEYQINPLGGPGKGSVIWYHWHDSAALPNRVAEGGTFGKKLTDLEHLDERTFGLLTGGLTAVPLPQGEKLRVHKYYFRSNVVELILLATNLSTRSAIDPDRRGLKTQENQVLGGLGGIETGLFFRFYFGDSVIKNGQYDTIVSEIGKYVLPEAEAKVHLEEQNTVEINIGIPEDEVVRQMGNPSRTIKVGTKTFLQYDIMTVTIEGGKVIAVDIK